MILAPHGSVCSLIRMFPFLPHLPTLSLCSLQNSLCSLLLIFPLLLIYSKGSPGILSENNSLNGNIFSSVFHRAQGWIGCLLLLVFSRPDCPFLSKSPVCLKHMPIASSTLLEHSFSKLSVISSHSLATLVVESLSVIFFLST